MRHFKFYENFYGAIKLMDEKQSGQYVKAICGYMFADETSQLKSPVYGYFKLAKRKLNLSRTRSKVEKKGGNRAKIPVSPEQVNGTQPFELKGIGMDGF